MSLLLYKTIHFSSRERSEQGHLMPASKIKMTVKNLLLTASPLEVVECPFFAILKPLVLPFLCCGFFIWSPSTAVARVEAMVAQLVFRYCCCSYCSVVERKTEKQSMLLVNKLFPLPVMCHFSFYPPGSCEKDRREKKKPVYSGSCISKKKAGRGEEEEKQIDQDEQ